MGIEFQWTESWFRSGATTVQPETDVTQTLFTDGTAAAPSRAYIDDTNLGSYRIGADNEGFSAGGVLRWDYNTTRINTTIPVLLPDGTAAAPALTFASATGVGLFRTTTASVFVPQSNLWEQRNGTAAQTFSVEGTFTDASNRETAELQWIAANQFRINVSALGAGSQRDLVIGQSGSERFRFNVSSAPFSFNPGTTNVEGLGSSGRRFVSLFVGTSGIDSTGPVLTTATQVRIGGAPATSLNDSLFFSGVTNASLATPTNGTVVYCSDCTIANPCAGGGTGALAKRLAGAWVCN